MNFINVSTLVIFAAALTANIFRMDIQGILGFSAAILTLLRVMKLQS